MGTLPFLTGKNACVHWFNSTVSRLPSFRLSHEAPLNEAISLPTKLGQTDDKRPDRHKSQKAPKTAKHLYDVINNLFRFSEKRKIKYLSSC